MGFFEDLALDERRLALDCDVVVGHWTARPDLDASPEALLALQARGGIDSAVVACAEAVWYDEERGNRRASALAREHGWVPCHAVNLRDTYGIGERLDEWVESGVRAIRLPGSTQGISPSNPGYRKTVTEAAARRLVMLVEGDFTAVQAAFRGLGAKAVFLDASYYELADFLLVAQEEPAFVVSTRRMLGPDSFEIICDEVGAAHLTFGSGTPLQDLEPTVWRLRDAALSPADFDAVAGGTLRSLLEA